MALVSHPSPSSPKTLLKSIFNIIRLASLNFTYTIYNLVNPKKPRASLVAPCQHTSIG